jgi:phosphoribosyl 1,2-cyclic phosphodiesterase
MIGFCPLASGSKGNAIYFATEKTKILIDMGISFLQVQKRLASLGVNFDEIQAILITHEHTDHIEGLKALAEKNVPIFVNADTAKGIYESFHFLPPCKIFTTGESFAFQDLLIQPFSICHDTLDPVAFVIKTDKYTSGFCTDLGYVTSLVQKSLQGCNFLYVEANHEVSMVHASPRPMMYKQRVLSRQGHLSNEEAAKLISAVYHPKLQHVHLAHLSSECNSPEKAHQVVSSYLEGQKQKVEISIAYQERVSRAVLFNTLPV